MPPHDREAPNGRARWLLSLLVPGLISVLVVGLGWSIRQHDGLMQQTEAMRLKNAMQDERAALIEARQVDVLRRLLAAEERLRLIELEVVTLRPSRPR